MGVSTDAILIWGLCDNDENRWVNLGREYDDPDYVEATDDDDDEDTDDEEDWEEVYAVRMGLERPPKPYGEHKDKYPPFWDARNKLVKDSGCQIDNHCSDGCLMPFVAVSDSVVSASRGYPVEVKSLEVKPEWEAKLRRFCEVMGIKWAEPKWWLVSWWG